MSFQYIQDYYGVPAERGRRVHLVGAKDGTITGAVGQYIEIHFDGEKKPKGPYHATDGITYLDEVREPPKLTRSQERWRRFREVSECFPNFRAFLKYEQQQQAS